MRMTGKEKGLELERMIPSFNISLTIHSIVFLLRVWVSIWIYIHRHSLWKQRDTMIECLNWWQACRKRKKCLHTFRGAYSVDRQRNEGCLGLELLKDVSDGLSQPHPKRLKNVKLAHILVSCVSS